MPSGFVRNKYFWRTFSWVFREHYYFSQDKKCYAYTQGVEAKTWITLKYLYILVYTKQLVPVTLISTCLRKKQHMKIHVQVRLVHFSTADPDTCKSSSNTSQRHCLNSTANTDDYVQTSCKIVMVHTCTGRYRFFNSNFFLRMTSKRCSRWNV